MKECCICGHTAEHGFVTYCDSCYDEESEFTQSNMDKLQKQFNEAMKIIKNAKKHIDWAREFAGLDPDDVMEWYSNTDEFIEKVESK